MTVLPGKPLPGTIDKMAPMRYNIISIVSFKLIYSFHQTHRRETMIEWLQMDVWPPYAVGIGIGVLSWLSFLFSDKPLSCSTAISQTSGMVEKIFKGRKAAGKEYYKKYPPKIDWRWMFLAGVFIGGFLSAQLSGSFSLRWVPGLWEQTFGGPVPPRLIAAFGGGLIMGFGSRWANGCTSGHGISGTLQLSVSSWVSVVFFFTGGTGCALFIYRVLGA
jgi:uncharacterized membrane protein YedE/YeeE